MSFLSLKKSTPAPVLVKAPELTLEQKLAVANGAASNALAAFSNAAHNLEVAADKLDDIRDAASEEATRLYGLKVEADQAAYKNREQAQKIRDLIG